MGPYEGPHSPIHYECGVWAQDHALNIREGTGASHVTDDHHKLYLGTHMPNSVRWTCTVLLDPCATPDKGSIDHTACQEGMEHRGQVVVPAYMTSDGQGIMTKDGDDRYSTRDGRSHNTRMPSLSSAGPTHGGERQHSPGDIPSLSLSHVP
jgi:hypothetical protein